MTTINPNISMIQKFLLITLISFIIYSLLTTTSLVLSQQIAFGYHGQEISLSAVGSQFLPLPSGLGNQIKVVANYTVQDASILNQGINAVMRVYGPNGTIIKRTSTGEGIIAQNSGSVQLVTTLADNSIKSVRAVILFTDVVTKKAILSNSLELTLNLGQKMRV